MNDRNGLSEALLGLDGFQRTPSVAIDGGKLLEYIGPGSFAPAIAAGSGVSAWPCAEPPPAPPLRAASRLARFDTAKHQRAVLARAGHAGTDTPLAG